MCVQVLLPLPGSTEPSVPIDEGEDEGPRVRIAVRRDQRDAERLADALQAADIDARVEIDDTQQALPGQSLLPGVLVLTAQLFAYPVTVPLAERARAEGILAAVDGQRARPVPASLLRSLAIPAAIGVAALVLRVAIG